jgi:hypothetical protein
MSRSIPNRWPCALALACPLVVATARGADEAEPKVIAAPEAGQHLDERCTVEMTIQSSKNAAPRGEYYLDSEKDFRDEKNLAVVISYDHADRFREAGIADPAEFYRDKMIRVTGKVI